MQANALLAVLRYGRRQPQSRMNQLVATSTTIEQTHQGPLPSPEQLEHYERILPGFSERAMKQWESQSEHRQQLERLVVAGGLRSQRTGQWMALVVAVVALVVAGAVGIWGHPVAGVGIAVADIGALAGVFVWGRSRQEAERADAPG